MDVAKLSAQGLRPFMHLIPEDVAEELNACINLHPDVPEIGSGFSVYGLFSEDIQAAHGALVVQVAGYSVLIRSLYVKPDDRGEGGATMLINELIGDVFRTDDMAEIELIVSEADEAEMEVAGFLQSIGFELEEADERYYRTSLSEINASQILTKVKAEDILPLSEVSEAELRKLGNLLSGEIDTFIQLPIEREKYEQDISMVCKTEGEIRDLVLISPSEKGLVISYALSLSGGLKILKLLAGAMQRALDKYGEDTEVCIPTVNPVSAGLVEKIIPGIKGTAYKRCFYSMLPLYEQAYGKIGEVER